MIMPFTIAHAAAAIPLKRFWPRYFSLTGLMAGSLSPDLLYFLEVTTEHRGFSHSWMGLLVFCLPAGILFSYAFHWLFKQHFIFSLPTPLDQRLSGLASARWNPSSKRDWMVLVWSVLLGGLTHFAWDSSTHAGGEVARAVPLLLKEAEWFGIRMQYCSWGQHVSTLLGILALIWVSARSKLIPPPAKKGPQRRPMRKVRFWCGGIAVAVLGSVLAVRIHLGTFTLDFSSLPYQFYVWQKLGLGAWAGFFWAVCGYTLVRRLIIARISPSVYFSDDLK